MWDQVFEMTYEKLTSRDFIFQMLQFAVGGAFVVFVAVPWAQDAAAWLIKKLNR